MAILVLLLAASAYHGLSPTWRLPMHDPAVILALLALSVALGWAVQRNRPANSPS
ncbi:hypothetical protein [Pseudomonas putida]|uniref:hypothetical protein n=1 Tax=Pseudomonas putida TaxID=303 RepID=UPI002DB7A649|nr:hypothetical protein [Pseudomonas putida]WRW01186.1 hypothetical protein VPZ82_15510 [Pseudomonas putida]